jgi:hypothetical protein
MQLLCILPCSYSASCHAVTLHLAMQLLCICHAVPLHLAMQSHCILLCSYIASCHAVNCIFPCSYTASCHPVTLHLPMQLPCILPCSYTASCHAVSWMPVLLSWSPTIASAANEQKEFCKNGPMSVKINAGLLSSSLFLQTRERALSF